MPKIKTRATVGSDGMVHLDVPIGEDHAGEEVEVTVEPTRAGGWRRLSQEEYRRRVLDLAGCIDAPTFERPPQGDYEAREPLG